MMDESNPYLPYIVNIEEAWYETPVGDRAVKTFKVNFADDKVWDNWRLEGPSFVWYFRGMPHVHVWVNVADDPSVELNSHQNSIL